MQHSSVVYGMLGIGLMLFCCAALYDRGAARRSLLKPAFWGLNAAWR
jgi:nitric oxide reductase large subunit